MLVNSKLFIFDILVHIVFLYTILCFFFFIVGIKEESNHLKTILNNNIDNVVEKIKEREPEISNNITKISELGIDIKKEIKDFIVKNRKNFKKNENKKYKNRAVIALVIIYVITFLTGLVFHYYFDISDKQLLSVVTENLTLFGGIMVIEALFFFYIILKYTPLQNTEFLNIFVKLFNSNLEKFNLITNNDFNINSILKNLTQ
jgi:hypothetical protein